MTICSADRMSAFRRLLLRFALVLLISSGGCSIAAALQCPPLVVEPAVKASSQRYSRGLLWSATTPGGQRSVILGTMHVADARVLAIADVARKELERSTLFVMEVVLDASAVDTLQSAMFYSDGRKLRDLLGADLFERTAARMSRYGVSADAADAMKPWAAFTTLSMPAGLDGAPLDLMLMSEARAAGKTVKGLETVNDQIAVFESLSEHDQTEMLLEIACHYDVFQGEIEQMIERYAARDLEGLFDLSLKRIDKRREVFLDALLWQRNDRMVERLLPILDAGAAFIAVGALHLAGNRGILERLEQLGYRVEALY